MRPLNRIVKHSFTYFQIFIANYKSIYPGDRNEEICEETLQTFSAKIIEPCTKQHSYENIHNASKTTPSLSDDRSSMTKIRMLCLDDTVRQGKLLTLELTRYEWIDRNDLNRNHQSNNEV